MALTALSDPEFDEDGYPTEETLERIRTWPFTDFAGCEAAMDFAGRAWKYKDYWEKNPNFTATTYPNPREEIQYVFSTGGWSGNESIIGAIEDNQMLQMIGAWSWRRGGHYKYRFPKDKDVNLSSGI